MRPPPCVGLSRSIQTVEGAMACGASPRTSALTLACRRVVIMPGSRRSPCASPVAYRRKRKASACGTQSRYVRWRLAACRPARGGSPRGARCSRQRSLTAAAKTGRRARRTPGRRRRKAIQSSAPAAEEALRPIVDVLVAQDGEQSAGDAAELARPWPGSFPTGAGRRTAGARPRGR